MNALLLMLVLFVAIVVIGIALALTLGLARNVWLLATYRTCPKEIPYSLLLAEAHVPSSIRSGKVLIGLGVVVCVLGFLLRHAGEDSGRPWLSTLGLILGIPSALLLVFYCLGKQSPWAEANTKGREREMEKMERTQLDQLSAKICEEGNKISVLGLYRRYWYACFAFDKIGREESFPRSLVTDVLANIQVLETHSLADQLLAGKVANLKCKVNELLIQRDWQAEADVLVSDAAQMAAKGLHTMTDVGAEHVVKPPPLPPDKHNT